LEYENQIRSPATARSHGATAPVEYFAVWATVVVSSAKIADSLCEAT
jgi:hypothetical protein